MNRRQKASDKIELETTSQRVKKTKQEIEQLRSDIQQLLNSTNQIPKPENNITAIENTVVAKVDQQQTELPKNLLKNPSTESVNVTAIENILVAKVDKKQAEPLKKSLKKPCAEHVKTSPSKIRSYNVAETREYIKKQKEKRAEQLKAQINVTDNKVDLKKQKLKELHQKTLELVSKNVQMKRERSKSREKPENLVRIDKKNPEKSDQCQRLRQKSQDREKLSQNKSSSHESRSRSRAKPEVAAVSPLLEPKTSLPKTKDLTKKFQSEPNIPQKRLLEHSVMTDACLKDTKETQTNRKILLEPPPCLSTPYNFINSVKRKLQLAINSPRSCIDVGVQNSLDSTPIKTKEEIKELLIKSAKSDLKSFASHKNLNLQSVENLHLRKEISSETFKNYDNSESDTSKNIPDISSESISVSKHLSLESLKDLKVEKKNSEKYTSDFEESKSVKESSARDLSEVDSETFKSMMTASLAKSERSKSLSLKEPSVSLTFRKNTITLKDDSESSLKTVLTEKSDFSSKSSSDFSQKTSLQIKENTEVSRKIDDGNSLMKNITLRPKTSINSNNVNEIHLKFEAEVRLLNDFNESFKQFVEVEKAFENLKTKNEKNLIFQNVDTQTSFVTKTSSKITEMSPRNSVNYSRGSEIIEELNETKNTSLSTDWNFSNIQDSTINLTIEEEDEKSTLSVSNIENYNLNTSASVLSLKIFDQLIKDEDIRIQQLKAIIKIREQALLDRTKGELVWLEIQKKQLIETGKIEEASLLKKKQRGIILKHEQERNEIKKLKQMQKEASEQRKKNLKQQRNFIKSHLTTERMSKVEVRKRKERRSLGPLRVVQSCSSEKSISLRSSEEERIPVANAKRTLLMREAALQKRRKAAEELLKWHRKLLDEERKINELEEAATSMVKRKDKYQFNGKQLNLLWKNMTGCDEKKFEENKVFIMSQMSLEKLCKSGRQFAKKVNSESEKSINYSSAFEPEDIITEKDDTKISSISELIDNFSRIEGEISDLGKKSEGIVSLKDEDSKPEESPSVSDFVKKSTETETVKSIEAVSKTEESSISDFDKKSLPLKDTGNSKTVEELIEIASKNEESLSVSNFENKSARIEDSKTVESIEAAAKVQESSSSSDKKSIETVESIEEVSKVEESSSISDLGEKSSEIVSTKDIEDSKKVPSVEVSRESSSVSDLRKKSSETVESIEATSKFEESSSVSDLKKSLKDIEDSEPVESIEAASKVEESDFEKKSVPLKDIEDSKTVESLEEAIEAASKIEESLSKFNEKLTSDEVSEQEETEEGIKTSSYEKVPSSEQEKVPSSEDSPSITNEAEESSVKDEASSDIEELPSMKEATESLSLEVVTPQKTDVKKRISEILDASFSRDKSPRLQDLYVTTYDIASNEPEEGCQMPVDLFGSEAEALWRKQLAIEHEIKQIEQQQKEQLPYVYMREIPNKPPPPYTPPSALPRSQNLLPSDVKELTEVCSYSSKVLYKAHQNNNLDKVKFSENGFKLFSKIDVNRICAEFIFNICRDVAKEHYSQFIRIEQPSWLVLTKKSQLARNKPPDAEGLERILVRKLKELFGFKTVQITESAIIKWGRKKRDHVDEVLVMESQEEESQWTNFDMDELIVKDKLTEDIMKMLLEETGEIFNKILTKRSVR